MNKNRSMPMGDLMLRFDFLGSGSKGNAYVIGYGQTRLLLDCGFSCREMVRRLHVQGILPDSLSAILITHEHRDHISGLFRFASNYRLPVFLSRGTARIVEKPAQEKLDLHFIKAGSEVRIGDLVSRAFAISHDAYEPLGFVFHFPDRRSLGMATDLGTITPTVQEALAGCQWLGLECNHDLNMLQEGPYPWVLKQRIRSTRGHLSNSDAADFLGRIASEKLKKIFGLHLSQSNNQEKKVVAAIEKCLAQTGLKIPFEVVHQDGPNSYSEEKQLSLFSG